MYYDFFLWHDLKNIFYVENYIKKFFFIELIGKCHRHTQKKNGAAKHWTTSMFIFFSNLSQLIHVSFLLRRIQSKSGFRMGGRVHR